LLRRPSSKPEGGATTWGEPRPWLTGYARNARADESGSGADVIAGMWEIPKNETGPPLRPILHGTRRNNWPERFRLTERREWGGPTRFTRPAPSSTRRRGGPRGGSGRRNPLRVVQTNAEASLMPGGRSRTTTSLASAGVADGHPRGRGLGRR